MTNFIIIMSIWVSLMFVSLLNPVILTLLLITQTLLVASLVSMWYNISWFAYMLVIIFLGAMMVAFTYITAIAPSDSTFPSGTRNFLVSLNFIFMASLALIFIANPCSLPSQLSFNTLNLIYSSHALNTHKIFSSGTEPMTLLLILALLIIMIAVINMVNPKGSPLRSSYENTMLCS
uniref:NADH dehydrogenase subunit 6 n=1 Tax=Bactrurus brachycaudus TaxID=111554 RepID=A0A6C0X537_9CRUS|nr:NADH dehydrogenase subunit 6 [Bactrurus brachycaudus]QIC54389.1 NADH dehydrogenase subunit 6 [Bactrurus brachycaudus]